MGYILVFLLLFVMPFTFSLYNTLVVSGPKSGQYASETIEGRWVSKGRILEALTKSRPRTLQGISVHVVLLDGKSADLSIDVRNNSYTYRDQSGHFILHSGRPNEEAILGWFASAGININSSAILKEAQDAVEALDRYVAKGFLLWPRGNFHDGDRLRARKRIT